IRGDNARSRQTVALHDLLFTFHRSHWKRCKPVHWRHAVTTPWFGTDALGKNRIGSLMRNIVDKVVRVSLTCVAQAATAAAQQSCLDVIRRAVLAVPTPTRILAPSDVEADLIGRRQALADRLADLLGLSTNMVNESSWLDQLRDATTGIDSQSPPVDSVIVQCEPQVKTRLLRLKSPTNVTTTAIMEGPVPVAVTRQHSSVPSSPLILSNETLIQEVKTATAFITEPSSCSHFKLNTLLRNSSVVTCNAPSLLSIPNSVCVAIPGATMLQSNSLPVETYTLYTTHTGSECGSVWPVETTSPSIKTTIYHTSTSPEIRYVIPPPSASLIPGKPTPVSEPWSSGLELIADADTNSLLMSTGSTTISTLSAAVVVTATETRANDATTSSITPEPIQSVTPVSATIAYQQPSTSHCATDCTVWYGSPSQGPTLSLLSLHPMTCHLIPREPEPGQLLTIQDLFRAGLLSTSTPWCLNFTIWFINSVAFEVENRAEHVSLRWGDFRLCRTADSRTEFLYFINRATHRAYYLAASDSTRNVLDCGPTNDAIDNFGGGVGAAKTRVPIRLPCPVAPRIPDQSDRCKPHLGVTTRRDWFLERPWGKNRVGSLLTEATRLAGLPMISLRKYRARTDWPNSVEAPMSNSLASGSESLPVELVSDSSAILDGENITTGSTEELNSGVSHLVVKRRKTSPICLNTRTLSTGRSSSLFSEAKSGLVPLLPSSSTILRPSSTLSCLPTSSH
ncbi:hypothetical protein FBUS_04261, partial [Fasciolopsis buskii]